MSDTPRTDEAEYECVDEPVVKLGSVDVDFCRQLERELNAANERIKRLEKAGDAAIHEASNGREEDAWEIWIKAKQSKP